ncbi:MAG: two-component system sensor histidine kinase KdbD, partial [Deltaproteobacteria bacterium]|nr:two-component system sensor histidine kinase KdbD [Deltaproteobacteria bacterium]
FIERATLNEALTRERRRLRAANQELKRLEKLKQDLTTMVIHDLKGPLAEVVANLHLMKEENLSPSGAEALESAHLGAEDLSRLIANLLDIGRLEEGRLQIQAQPLSIREETSWVLGRMKTLLDLKRLKVVMSIEPDLPLVKADVNLLRRIIQNLVTNAVDHTPEESSLRFGARLEEGMMTVSLADQGPGVPPEHREAIFEMFSQLPGRKMPRTSTGLGLTFCRLAVEAHGGRIWVQDGPRGGADFRFTLPLAEAQ